MRVFWNRKAGCNHLSGSAGAAPRARPCEKRDCCSGPAGSIAIIKMVSRWIVEIDGAFGETQPECLSIKINVALRIAGNGGDMVNPLKLH